MLVSASSVLFQVYRRGFLLADIKAKAAGHGIFAMNNIGDIVTACHFFCALVYTLASSRQPRFSRDHGVIRDGLAMLGWRLALTGVCVARMVRSRDSHWDENEWFAAAGICQSNFPLSAPLHLLAVFEAPERCAVFLFQLASILTAAT